jgi:hypothetical protein
MNFPPTLHSIAYAILGRADGAEVRVIRGTVTGYAVRVAGDTQEELVTLATATGEPITVPASVCVTYAWAVGPAVTELFEAPTPAEVTT